MEPIELRHRIDRSPPKGPNAFRWEGGCLIFTLRNRELDCTWELSVIPTASQWQGLWSVCDEIEFWSWPRWLGDHVMDGLPWSTEIQVGTRSVISFGQLVGCPPGFPAKLLRLHRALQALTGWQPSGGDDHFAEGIEASNLAWRSLLSGVPWHLWQARRGRPLTRTLKRLPPGRSLTESGFFLRDGRFRRTWAYARAWLYQKLKQIR